MSLNTEALRSGWAIRGHANATRAEIVDFRDRQLRRLVQHAYRTVLYYRALWDEHGVHPDCIRGAAARMLDMSPLAQERVDSIIMNIVPRGKATVERVERVRALGATLLGPDVRFELLIDDSIPAEPRGKYRPALSHVASSYDGVLVPSVS